MRLALSFLLLIPSVAHAGWTAEQRQSVDGRTQQAQVTYGHHRLKIENGDQTMFIDLRSGDMTFVHVSSQRYATVTLEELVRMQNQALAQMESQLDALPPALQADVRAQLDAQRKAAGEPLKVQKSERTRTVEGRRCRVHTWRTVDGDGQACIAEKDPIDLGSYRDDARKLKARLLQTQAGGTRSNMVFLELATYGFPLETEQTLKMGPRSISTTVAFTDLKSVEVSEAAMSPPTSYTKVSFKEMMGTILPGGF